MAHTHSHQHDSDTYYLDQLCLIALSGAFAGVCLTMYFWQPHMLRLMLAPLFHKFVLWSGLALLALVLVRSITLWRAVGRQQQHMHDHASDHAHAHDHDHDHGHHHHHAHGQHSHEAGHSHVAVAEAPCPALPHEHGHDDCSAHEQDPEDGCCGHDHGWAPWRYVILLLPIMLYLLGLPSQPPSAMGGAVSVDLNEEAQLYAGLVGAGTSPLGSLPFAARTSGDRIDGPAKQVGLKELEGAAFDPGLRERWQGKVIRVVGQFAPDPRSDRVFQLVRYRIQCCAADAIRVNILGLCRESLAGVRPNAWVQVTGRVAFQETQPGTFVTFLQVPGRQLVGPTDPDPNPYIQ